ncbi:MAG: oligosaccharide flippase family protein, partial [Clostridiales bacterium]|nr:oligosaccharide flippase family protein [Clostridiales bacterium]
DMLTTTVNLIMPIFTLLVYEAVMRYALDKTGDKQQVFSIGLYITVIGCLVVVFGVQFLRFFAALKPYIWLFILYYISLAFYNLILQFIKGIEKVAVYSVAGVINTFVHIICNIIFLLCFRWGVQGYLMAFIIGHSVAAVYAFCMAGVYRYVISYSKLKVDYLKKMLHYACPMIPNSISWWVSNSSDKYILTYFWGVTVNGIYSVAYKIPSILTIIINIFISAWQISSVEDFGSESSKKFYSDIYDKYEGILFMGASFLIGFSPILAKFLFSNAFYDAWRYTPVLVLASVWNSLSAFYGSIYTAAKKTNMLMYSTLAGAVGNILLNLALIPTYGAMGAAIATMISYAIVWLMRAIHSRKIFAFDIKVKRDIIINVVLLLEIVLVCTEHNPYYIVSILSVAFICHRCRETLKIAINMVMRKKAKIK